MKKKTYYLNGFNLAGLLSAKPIVCDEYEEWTKAYWDKSGDFKVEPDNLEVHEDGLIKFASEDKHEVELWTKGAIAVLQSIYRLVKYK